MVVTPFSLPNTVTMGLLAAPCCVELDGRNTCPACRGSMGKGLEEAHARQLLLTLASSVGGRTCVRPLKWSSDVLAQMLGLPVDRVDGPRVGSMSSGWLRAHEVESGKHSAGQ